MEIELNGRKLRVYECGKIESFYKCKWHELNGTTKNGYCEVSIIYKKYMKHRVIGIAYLGLDIDNQKLEIDHIDRNRANNNLSNLRIVTKQQNAYNRSNVKGCWFDKREKKYVGQIKVGGKAIRLGTFATEDEAHNAYLLAKEKYHII